MGMTTIELAHAAAALCRESRFTEVKDSYWSDDIVAIEAMKGPMARLEGRAAVMHMVGWWNANHMVHETTAEGLFVCHDDFALVAEIDVTPKDQPRMKMRKLVEYKTAGGKIVGERYFYAM